MTFLIFDCTRDTDLIKESGYPYRVLINLPEIMDLKGQAGAEMSHCRVRVDSDRMRCVLSLRIIASKITHA